jgi:hypothetical protein
MRGCRGAGVAGLIGSVVSKKTRRPDLMMATIADAMIGPTPGIVASRRLASLSLCQATIANSIPPHQILTTRMP